MYSNVAQKGRLRAGIPCFACEVARRDLLVGLLAGDIDPGRVHPSTAHYHPY